MHGIGTPGAKKVCTNSFIWKPDRPRDTRRSKTEIRYNTIVVHAAGRYRLPVHFASNAHRAAINFRGHVSTSAESRDRMRRLLCKKKKEREKKLRAL